MIAELLVLLNKESEITADEILSFGNVKATKVNPNGSFSVEQSRWTLWTKIILKKGDVANLNETIETTIGRALANRILKIDPFGTHFKYDNKPTIINDFINVATVSLMNGDITSQQMMKMFNNAIWLSRFADMILPSLSQKILVTPKVSVDLRVKLVKDNQDVIAAGDISYISKVEKPVMDSIVSELKDDPSFMMYTLGKPSVGNHMKQTIGVFSPVMNIETGKFEFPEGNLMTGLSSENYNILANINIAGTYGRAVQTQDGGAIVKSLYNSMNIINAGPKDSDCGSMIFKKITLTSSNKKMYMWNYMYDNGRLLLLSPDVYTKYENKVCYFRSPLYCKYDGSTIICNKCCGEIPYRTNMMSIGSMSSKVGFNFVQLSLKGFHDSTVKLAKIEPFEFMKIM